MTRKILTVLCVASLVLVGASVLAASEWSGTIYYNGNLIATFEATLDDRTGELEAEGQTVGSITPTITGSATGQGTWDVTTQRWYFTNEVWSTDAPATFWGYWSGYFDIGGLDDGTAAGIGWTYNNNHQGTWYATRD
jgi:hypothetical protein